MTDDPLIRRTGALIEAEVDGELVALHVDRGTCYGFNGTATRIWAMLAEPKRLSELRDALVAEYEVDADTCERQLRTLVEELGRDGLVEVAGAA